MVLNELILSLFLLMSLLVRDISTTAWIFSCIFWLLMYIANCTFTSHPNVVVPLFLPMAFEGNIYKDMRMFVVFVVWKDPLQHFLPPRFLFQRRVKIDLDFFPLII